MNTDEIQFETSPELTPYKISDIVTVFMSDGQDINSVVFHFFAHFLPDTILIAYTGILEEARLVSCQALEFTIAPTETTNYQVSVSFCNGFYSIAILVDGAIIVGYLVSEKFSNPEIELTLESTD